MDPLADLRERTVKNFLDILILAELDKDTLSGHDIVFRIHKEHDVLLSSGTVYGTIYAMERVGLIKGMWGSRKRIYTLTQISRKQINRILKVYERFRKFLRELENLYLTE